MKNQSVTLIPEVESSPETWRELFCRQLADFAAAVVERRQPFVPGHEGRRSMALIESCYASRHLLTLPWTSPGPERLDHGAESVEQSFSASAG
jgi:hypothetical protein